MKTKAHRPPGARLPVSMVLNCPSSFSTNAPHPDSAPRLAGGGEPAMNAVPGHRAPRWAKVVSGSKAVRIGA